VAVGLSISTIRRLIQSGRLSARFERGDKGQHRYFIARADLATLAAIGKGTSLEPRSTPARPAEGGGERGAGSAGKSGVPDRRDGKLEPPEGHHDPPSQGVHGALADGAARAGSGPAPQPPPAAPRAGAHGAHAEGVHEALGDQAAHLELAVLRERLAGAQEAVRLHAERVRGQAKEIGFLQSQLDRSREAEEQLRVLLARLTAALPPPATERPALEARDITPPQRVRWWQRLIK